MRIVHITPHLPPDQAANALLPFQLGEWAAARGDSVHFIAHPPAHASATRAPTSPGFRGRSGRCWQTTLRAGIDRRRLAHPARRATRCIEAADIVHVHSNGLLPEVGAAIAHRLGKPVVLTLYGTEIWHYRPKRSAPISSRAPTRRADAVTFYSRRLLERARELGLDRPRLSRHLSAGRPVVRVPRCGGAAGASGARSASPPRNLLVNVKRLHPLAGQRYLLEAMPDVLREHPDTHLVICGTGALLPELQAVARSAGVERHVTFAGLVDNAVRRALLRRGGSLRPAVAARGAADRRGRGARVRHAGRSRRTIPAASS